MRQKIPPTCCVQPRRKTGTVQQTPAAGRGQEGLMFVWPSVLPSIALTSGFSFLQQQAHGRRKKRKWLNQKEVELPTLSGRKTKKATKAIFPFSAHSPNPRIPTPNPKPQPSVSLSPAPWRSKGPEAVAQIPQDHPAAAARQCFQRVPVPAARLGCPKRTRAPDLKVAV